jgi:hypothetical protein
MVLKWNEFRKRTVNTAHPAVVFTLPRLMNTKLISSTGIRTDDNPSYISIKKLKKKTHSMFKHHD